MTNWRDYLKPEELKELRDMARVVTEYSRQRRRIYDRCRKRMGRAEG